MLLAVLVIVTLDLLLLAAAVVLSERRRRHRRAVRDALRAVRRAEYERQRRRLRLQIIPREDAR